MTTTTPCITADSIERPRSAPLARRLASTVAAALVATTLSAAAFAAPPLVTFTSAAPWPTGYSGSIAIQNNGAAPIAEWTLTFTGGPSWSDMWNGIGSVNGGESTIVHAAWNGTIAPGATVTVGFTGVGTLTENVLACAVNGAPASVAYIGAVPGGEGSPLAILTAALPDAGVGVSYAHTLIATGGSAPYSWSLESGTLPAGLALAPSGAISGTPLALGSSSCTFAVTDSALATATRALALTVTEPPTLSIADAQIVLNPLVDPDGGGAPGFLSTSGNQIVDAAGAPVRISGVNWFGFETGTHVAHGLWTRNYRDVLDQVQALGFNTVRLPYSNAMLEPGSATSSINFAANPELAGLSPLEVLDAVIAHCGEIGLRVLLDRHSAMADNYFNEDLWYIPGSPVYTEERWIADWVLLATRYLGNPTVIGADLFNEPKKTATWGASSPATDWNKAAERCGNAILAVNPDWLIVVEGTEKYDGQNTWWGGNLAGAAANPVVLDVPGKLVYSMHDYPASVYAQPWFGAPDYPANLAGVWHGFWGYLFEEGTAPLLLGEFGSKLATVSDQLWLDTLTDYIDGDLDLDGAGDLVGTQKGMSWTYWSLNPNSSDTGGILADDWISVNAEKMEYLAASLAPPLKGGGGQPAQVIAFAVSLSAAPAAGATVTVPWTTVDGSAVTGTDYIGASGTLTFAEGDVEKEIAILVPPHTASATTQFTVQLAAPGGAPTGAALADAIAVGTILAGCPGDLDGSGAVDGGDLGALLGAWGGPGAADLDGSGMVDGADMGVLLAAWGGC